MSVPFGLILSLIFLNEKISLIKWILIFTSFVGILILSYDPRFVQELYGLLTVTIMAFFYAISNILSRFLKEVNTITQIGWHCIVGFILLISFSFVFEGNPVLYLLPLNYDLILTIIQILKFVEE